MNVRESTLCDKCSVLRFNDKELGGHKTQSHDGEEVLSFMNENDRRERYRELWLDYIHEDSFPDLPCLRAAAEAGCAFCAMLRSVALELGFAKPIQVTFKLLYLWHPHTRPQFGLCTLIARLQLGHIEFEGWTNYRLIFYIDCKEGDGQPDLPEVLTDRTRQLPAMAQNSTYPTEPNVM